MNFQAVEQANGNLVMMFGIFTEVGGVTYTANQKAKCSCKITDDTGTAHKVNIYQGKGQLPGPQQARLRYQFNLSTFQGNYQGNPYTGYSGFWNSTAQVGQQQGQQAPPQAPQAPSQATGQAQDKKEVDWDAKDLRQARMNGLNNATRLICLLAEMTKNDTSLNTDHVKGVAGEFVDYIYHGLRMPGPATPNSAMSGEDSGPPPSDDDVPWES